MSYGLVEVGMRPTQMLTFIGTEAKQARLRAEFAAASILERHVKDTIRGKFGAGTGEFPRSYKAVMISGNAAVVSDLVYARIQDKGGTIRPRRRKFLAIPISQEAKKKAKTAHGLREWPRDRLRIIKTRKGTLIAAEIKDKMVTVHYVLKKEVTLSGKQYLTEALKSAKGPMQDAYDAQMKRAAKRAAQKIANG